MIRPRLGAVAVIAASATLLLTGCFFGPSAPTSGGGTGGGGQSGQTDGDDTEVPGDVDLDQFQGVPATFPTGEIPLVAGDVPIGIDLGTGWTVVVQVADTETAFAEASGMLISAGFETLASQSSPDGSFGAFENAKYQVQVTAAETADYGTSVTYVVVTLE